MEFDYAKEESIYCRPPLESQDKRPEIPAHLKTTQVAYLPPMSVLAIYDRLKQELPNDPTLIQQMWTRREIENYLCQAE